jgi:hypothetical protein
VPPSLLLLLPLLEPEEDELDPEELPLLLLPLEPDDEPLLLPLLESESDPELELEPPPFFFFSFFAAPPPPFFASAAKPRFRLAWLSRPRDLLSGLKDSSTSPSSSSSAGSIAR